MAVESIQVPAERIPPVASDMAGTSKAVAGVLLFFASVFALAMLGVFLGENPENPVPEGSAEAAGYWAGAAIALGLVGGVPALFGFRAVRNASRATRAGNLAKQDPSYTWRLSGKYIIAADAAGAPHPELSFKLNRKLRTMLLALPRADLHAG